MNLPIYGVKSKSLMDFTTTRKDLKKGVSRIPLELARIRSEDIVQIQKLNNSCSEGKKNNNSSEDGIDISNDVDERNGAYLLNHIP